MRLAKRLSKAIHRVLNVLKIIAVLLFIGIVTFIAWAAISLTEKFVDSHTEVSADEWF
jgi:TRAP-type C4-dicarboxylate transport system permease small subunit